MNFSNSVMDENKQLKIYPCSNICGTLQVVGDKSISHRVLLIAALADGDSQLKDLSNGDDIDRTKTALGSLGISIKGELGLGKSLKVQGNTFQEPEQVLDMGNSGTGLRLLSGILSGMPWLSILSGDSSLRSRPMKRIVDPLRQMGANIQARCEGTLAPLVIKGGNLSGIDFWPKIASAQVKSAVLLAGLFAKGQTTVHEPIPTRIHTEELLLQAGANIEQNGLGQITIRQSSLSPLSYSVPGDPSQAAFWIVAACIVPGSKIVIPNLYIGPARAEFLKVLIRMGANINIEKTSTNIATIYVEHSSLRATEVKGDEVPGLIDEIPILAVAAIFASGTTVFKDASELKTKETDRIFTTVSELGKFYDDISATTDGIIVQGNPKNYANLRSSKINSYGDHRIAMASSIAALAANGPTIISNWNAVDTSYPNFIQDLIHLGGNGYFLEK